MAGRKKDPRNVMPLNTTVPEKTKEGLVKLSEKHGSMGAVIEYLVDKELKKKKP